MPPRPRGGEAFLLAEKFFPMSPSPHSPARWEKRGETTLAKTVVFALQSVRYRHPVRGAEKDFVVVRAPDWVNVLALTPGGALVLVRQFRFGVDEFSLEIPGGVMEAGEDLQRKLIHAETKLPHEHERAT